MDVVLTVDVVILLAVKVLPNRVENRPELILRLEMNRVEPNWLSAMREDKRILDMYILSVGANCPLLLVIKT